MPTRAKKTAASRNDEAEAGASVHSSENGSATEQPRNGTTRIEPGESLGAAAVALLRFLHQPSGPEKQGSKGSAGERQGGTPTLLYVARDANRAGALLRLLQGLEPSLPATLFPAWDCPPYDRAPPSRGVMGTRMGVLRWLTDREAPPRLVVTTPEALIQRVPPRKVWETAHVEFRLGETLDVAGAETSLRRIGYVLDDRVDEPGEAAFRGRVIDLFPAASPLPCRIEHEDGRITAIHSYDPLSQRTEAEAEVLLVDPASEIVQVEAEEAFPLGQEHWLPSFYDGLETVFDYAEAAVLAVEDGADLRSEAFFEQIREGYEGELALRGSAGVERTPANPASLYLDAESFAAHCDKRLALTVGVPAAAGGAEDDPAGNEVPRFVSRRNAARGFAEFMEKRLAAGGRVVLAGPAPALRGLVRRAERVLERSAEAVPDWATVRAAQPGSLLALALPVERGFIDAGEDIAVIAAADLFGSRARVAAAGGRGVLPTADADFRIGDAVVHLDHGVGVLEGIEPLSVADGPDMDVVRLGFAKEAKLMMPVTELGAVWRYGGDPEALTLDRLDGDAWAKRRAEVEAEINAAASRMVELAKERSRQTAPKLVPPAREYERFSAGFTFALTWDQAEAVEAVLADLGSGRPMDRLVCGDVGYGKTEVALRAAAAAALSGKQVALVVPTTVLVRQYLRTLRRRFSGFKLEVAQLSRLAKPAEVRRVKEGLASGKIRLVVGTHALAAKGVAFADLGLVVIDEEQRFGARHKQHLRDMAAGAHVLTLTATPIPRTLQASLVGLQDLSIIATPPVLRQPVRTLLTAFDSATIRQALRREKQRQGQSFFVCPRIEDIEPMAARLREIAPELRMVVAHGKMPAEDVDGVMMRFADGEGDVLLATNIIESGLDVPNANTMMVWHADRFGLAQLHQLRGRVGRGSRRGVAYLLSEGELAPATEKRLRTLEAFDQLGAGFAISARDLDLRGAGDLMGEEQAGHVKLIGLGLYQHLLQRALETAEGAAPDEEWTPEINLGVSGRIPDDYIPEPEMRLNLYAKLAAAADAAAVASLEDEVADRFGPLPEPMAELFALAETRVLCRDCAVSRLDGGPQALATTFRPGAGQELAGKTLPDDLAWSGERLVLKQATQTPGERLRLARGMLQSIASLREADRSGLRNP